MRCSNCGTANELESTACIRCNRKFISVAAVAALDEKAGFPIGSLILMLFAGLYLLNPTAGFDFLPDGFPLIGNLDEVGAVLLLLRAASNIGWVHFSRRKTGEVMAILNRNKLEA